MDKQKLAELAAAARAPEDLIAGILESESNAELEIYRVGLAAWIGQNLQALGEALARRGQRVDGARVSAAGRQAASEWERIARQDAR